MYIIKYLERTLKRDAINNISNALLVMMTSIFLLHSTIIAYERFNINSGHKPMVSNNLYIISVHFFVTPVRSDSLIIVLSSQLTKPCESG